MVSVRYLVGAVVGLLTSGLSSLVLYDPDRDNPTLALIVILGCGLLAGLATVRGVARFVPEAHPERRLTSGTFLVASLGLLLVTTNVFAALRDESAPYGQSRPQLLLAFGAGVIAFYLIAWQLPRRFDRFRDKGTPRSRR